MSAKLTKTLTEIEFEIKTDSFWPWGNYDYDEYSEERAPASATAAAVVDRDVLGSKDGTGKISIPMQAVKAGDVTTIMGWSRGGDQLTLTIPKEYFNAGSDVTHTVKIQKDPSGSYFGIDEDGDNTYFLNVDFIII